MNNKDYIILFDGICNLCNFGVDFVIKRDKEKLFRFVSLQSNEGKKLVTNYKIAQKTDSVILIKNNDAFVESDAAIEIGNMLPAPWKWASAFRFIPRKIRDMIYRWVARNRYRWFGKRKTCRVI